jgi:hypothetical protein
MYNWLRCALLPDQQHECVRKRRFFGLLVCHTGTGSCPSGTTRTSINVACHRCWLLLLSLALPQASLQLILVRHQPSDGLSLGLASDAFGCTKSVT